MHLWAELDSSVGQIRPAGQQLMITAPPNRQISNYSIVPYFAVKVSFSRDSR